MQSDRNIVLIGMPFVGKSTVGVLLSKVTCRSFIDSDLVVQAREGMTLQQIIDSRGLDEFMRIEEQAVLEIRACASVIATGGSVVYSDAAMRHLRDAGIVVHLDLPLGLLLKRVEQVESRGVVMTPGQDIADLYASRQSIYRRWAQITVDCSGLDQSRVVSEILNSIRAVGQGQNGL